jgi:hypothetical protein
MTDDKRKFCASKTTYSKEFLERISWDKESLRQLVHLNPAVESISRVIRRGDRLVIKAFSDEPARAAFLAEGDNARRWSKSARGLAPGTYAYVKGKWTNVEDLDMDVLIHV